MSFLEPRARLFGVRVNQGLSAVGQVEEIPMTGSAKESHSLSHFSPGSLISSLMTFVEKESGSFFPSDVYFFRATGERNRGQKGSVKI